MQERKGVQNLFIHGKVSIYLLKSGISTIYVGLSACNKFFGQFLDGCTHPFGYIDLIQPCHRSGR
jgi:hypothetical protein